MALRGVFWKSVPGAEMGLLGAKFVRFWTDFRQPGAQKSSPKGGNPPIGGKNTPCSIRLLDPWICHYNNWKSLNWLTSLLQCWNMGPNTVSQAQKTKLQKLDAFRSLVNTGQKKRPMVEVDYIRSFIAYCYYPRVEASCSLTKYKWARYVNTPPMGP